MPTPRKHESCAQRQRAYRSRQAAARLAELSVKGLPRASSISIMPSAARWTALLRQTCALLGTLRAEMESYWDERSEPWQDSSKGEAVTETIEPIDEILDAMEGVFAT